MKKIFDHAPSYSYSLGRETIIISFHKDGFKHHPYPHIKIAFRDKYHQLDTGIPLHSSSSI